MTGRTLRPRAGRKLGEVGYLGATIDESLRRPQPRLHRYGLIVEAIGRADPPPHGRLVDRMVRPRSPMGLGEQKQRWLRGSAAARGSLLRLTEPTPVRRRQPPTRATKTPTAGRSAPEDVDLTPQRRRGALISPDRPGKAQGLAAFLVPTDVSRSQREIHGSSASASDTASCRFYAVEVGDERCSAQVGDGFKVAMTALPPALQRRRGLRSDQDGCVEPRSSTRKSAAVRVPLARFSWSRDARRHDPGNARRRKMLSARRLRRRRQPNTMETRRKVFATSRRSMAKPRHPGPRRLPARRRLPGRYLRSPRATCMRAPRRSRN